MKQPLVSFSLLFLIAGGSFIAFPANAQDSLAQEGNPNDPKATFESVIFDFGDVETGANPNIEFAFTNTGRSPLIITDAKSACGGCLVATWPKEPIPPGETAVIAATYDMSRLGPTTQTITVSSNAAQPTLKLTVTGNISAPSGTKP